MVLLYNRISFQLAKKCRSSVILNSFVSTNASLMTRLWMQLFLLQRFELFFKSTMIYFSIRGTRTFFTLKLKIRDILKEFWTSLRKNKSTFEVTLFQYIRRYRLDVSKTPYFTASNGLQAKDLTFQRGFFASNTPLLDKSSQKFHRSSVKLGILGVRKGYGGDVKLFHGVVYKAEWLHADTRQVKAISCV